MGYGVLDMIGRGLGAGYKADVIARELFNYLFASITNTYTAAHLTLMRIITDEPLLARVRAEIDAVLGAGRKGKLVLDSATMAQFKLLDGAWHDTRRSAAVALLAEPDNECRMPDDMDLKGHQSFCLAEKLLYALGSNRFGLDVV
jgi:hypothetical protein